MLCEHPKKWVALPIVLGTVTKFLVYQILRRKKNLPIVFNETIHIYNVVSDFWLLDPAKEHSKKKITTVCFFFCSWETRSSVSQVTEKRGYNSSSFPQPDQSISKQTTNSHKNTKNRDKSSKQSANEWLKRTGRDWSYHLDSLPSSSFSLYLSFSFSFSQSQMAVWHLAS